MKQEEQKARELVNKFKEFVNSEKNIIDDRSYHEIITSNAKQCALICVDEIINDNPNIYDSDRLNHGYWKLVRQEIESL